EVIGHLPASDQVWYQDTEIAGDNTVAAISARDMFQAIDTDTDRLTLQRIDGFVGHSGLLSNVDSQREIVSHVASGIDEDFTAFGQHLENSALTTLENSIDIGILDPKEFVLD